MKSKEKFYKANNDIFLRYFDNSEQYEALITAGNFKKIEEIIKEKSEFNSERFIEAISVKI